MIEVNQKLGALFTSMAGLLGSRGENPYKVRAYRRAADVMGALQENIGEVAARGELQNLPGIGNDLAAKIQEFLSTGQIRAYEELKTPLPPLVQTWVHLPGFSEPIVHHLFFRLGIETWEDLEALARSHLLTTLPGLAGKSEEILDSIKNQRSIPSDT